jgi:hypothetical protein
MLYEDILNAESNRGYKSFSIKHGFTYGDNLGITIEKPTKFLKSLRLTTRPKGRSKKIKL